MSIRLINVDEVLRRLVKMLDGYEEGEAVAFALRIMEERDASNCEMGQLEARVDELEREIVRLRAIFPEVLRRLGSGACTPDCYVEFLSQIPNEVGLVTDALRARVAELEYDNARGALYVEHLKGRVTELEIDNTRLVKALASSCDEERSMGIEEGPHHATCGLTQELNARIAELEKQK